MSALPEQVTGYNNCLSGHAVILVDRLSLNKGQAIVPVDMLFQSQLSLNKGQAVVPVDRMLLQWKGSP